MHHMNYPSSTSTMRSIRLLFWLPLLLLDLATSAQAQKFIYDVEALSFFDNREYDRPNQRSQTIYGIRLSPTIGVAFKDSTQGRYHLVGGLHYIQPMGGNWRNIHLWPTLYIEMLRKGFSIALGAIPYTKRIDPIPAFMRYDSLAYAYPNIQGALFQYVSKWGFAEFMCDWRGLPSPTKREMFLLLLNGQFHYKLLFTGGYAQLNHKASYGAPNHDSVCDDIFLNPYLGVDLTAYTPLDSLSLRAGYVWGMQRIRNDLPNDTFFPQGFLAGLTMRWRWVGLRTTVYYGKPLMPLYPIYGPDLNRGDPFYQSNFYSCTSLYLYLVHNRWMYCYFAWNFHLDNTHRLQHQQQLIARFNLSRIGTKNAPKLPLTI